ncbi:MAG: IPT/TIG domain-containing protein, partial [Pontibacter sp.]|nr:IPT/TIG domain-containing protein [Pontibacter sp.]
SAQTGQFKVSTSGGETVSEAVYRVWQEPGITGLSKHTDRAGTNLRIMGIHFAEDKSRNKVYLGQVEAQVLEASPEALLIRIPQAEGRVKVLTPGGEALSNETFNLIPAPVLTQMQPAKGSVGTAVELRGQNFTALGQQDTVSFNGVKAQVISYSENLLKVAVPRGVSTGKVEIKGAGGVTLSTTDFVVEELTLAESIVISPNPSDGRFTLDLHKADFEVQRLQVYSALGQLVQEQSISAPRPDTIQLQLPKTQAGMYLLHLHTDRGLLTFKLHLR